MVSLRRLLPAGLLLLAIAAVAAVVVPGISGDAAPREQPAATSDRSVSEDIFRDYALDRVIDGQYDAADLEATLTLARDDPAFREFADAVQETYDRDMLGLSTGGTPQPVAVVDEGTGLLPTPVLPGERSQPPWPFIALSALGAALLLTGAGSSIVRRARR